MPNESDGRPLKRKRVAKACETCRVMKAKCDGARPSCARCLGYSYKCAYSTVGRSSRGLDRQADQPRDTPAEVEKLKAAIDEYDDVVRGIAPVLPEPERGSLEGRLAPISERIHGAMSRVRLVGAPSMQVIAAPCLKSRPLPHFQRYLGEVSDVRFFNLVERALQERNLVPRSDEGMDSYEQDDPVPEDATEGNDVSIELPSPQMADEFLDIYFSTVHVAYPFIPKSTFMRTYRAVRDGGSAKDVDSSWVALLYILFAIGAYYTSFPGKDTNMLHEHYFQRALSLSGSEPMERSINQVSFLLAECFYLLAVCRTDRCWTALGIAVRFAQSIGLHVETEGAKMLKGQVLLKTETRRRIWYSLYVLDRLLSLQLGRPPAVHDDDFNVLLPSRLGDADIEWESDDTQLDAPEGPSTGDYFLSVISLSKIIGHVLRGLYSPRGETVATEMSGSTSFLDKQLLDWKSSLPRTLRFDFGHAFETSLTFRRQRNMLAIKFHHLRALIHRPYLCLRLLRHPINVSSTMCERQLLDRFERTCVAEARETAHLLHNVTDEKELVHDFPWWQMISCLICASSILLVASVFTRQTGGVLDRDFDVATLHDDSETCLKVFEALSANSEGARIAKDMMARLKERGLKWADANTHHLTQESRIQTADNNVDMQLHVPTDLPSHFEPSGTDHFEMPSGDIGAIVGAQDWPSEILDSMTWSAQFFDAVDNPPLSPFFPR